MGDTPSGPTGHLPRCAEKGGARDRQNGVAAEPGLDLARQAALGRERLERGAEIVARGHIEGGEPAAQSGPERAGQPGASAEIDEMQRAAGRKNVERALKRLAPGRDHRQGVGDHDAIEPRAAEQSRRIERRGVPLAQRNARGKSGARHRGRRARQHLPRYVETEQMGPRIGPRQFDQIASGAAADLEHAHARPGVKAGDRLVPAEEIEFAAQVIDVALAAIHPVHELQRRRSCFRRPSSV